MKPPAPQTNALFMTALPMYALCTVRCRRSRAKPWGGTSKIALYRILVISSGTAVTSFISTLFRSGGLLVVQTRSNAWKYAVLLLFVGVSLQGLSFAACIVLARRGLIYDPVPATKFWHGRSAAAS